MKFNENRPKGSRGMRRARKCYGQNDRLTDRLTVGLTDERHSYNPLPLGGGGLNQYDCQLCQWPASDQHFSGGPLVARCLRCHHFYVNSQIDTISVSHFLGRVRIKSVANGFLPGTQYFPKTTTTTTGQHSIPVIKV